MEQSPRRTHTSEGSLMVDAAISLPLFIIALAMFLMAVRIMNIEENVTYRMLAENEALSLLPGIEFTVNRPYEELYIDRVRYNIKPLYTRFPFKAAFFNAVIGEITIPYRPFEGESDDPYKSKSVIIFPKNEGNEKQTPKYHDSSCWQLKSHRKNEMEIVSEEEAKNRGYSPCLICGG